MKWVTDTLFLITVLTATAIAGVPELDPTAPATDPIVPEGAIILPGGDQPENDSNIEPGPERSQEPDRDTLNPPGRDDTPSKCEDECRRQCDPLNQDN